MKCPQCHSSRVRKAESLPEDDAGQPIIAELDELQTYVGQRTCKVWL